MVDYFRQLPLSLRTAGQLALMVMLVLVSFTVPARASDDILLADFESESYAPWIAAGDAFGPGPAKGTLLGQMEVSGYNGERLVNSFYQGDQSTGTLTSPEFTIERTYIGFLIGGGRDPERLALQLIVDDQVVRSATGLNDEAGGSEALEPDFWDVSSLIGQSATLRIVDKATGGWGHINVDHIVQTNNQPPGFLKEVEREFVATTRYLNIPIRNGAKPRKVTLWIDGQRIVKNDIELADENADWWAPMDIGAWQGQTFTIEVDRLPSTSRAVEMMELSDEIKHADNLYHEPLRGQFHFSPRRGWSNDPNGMVFYNGEYHLFFQHNPYGWGWGNMHWGHAVSNDLVHWEELRDELLPDDFGPMFSGSAVVDWQNTSGFGTKDNPPLVLLYTAAGNPTVQCLAYSTDGRNFTKYSGNPIIPEITGGNRDPKVIWHQASERWVMVLYVELDRKHTVHFFTSPNLKDWNLASITEGDLVGQGYLFECPDLFELAVDGDASASKWVLTGADSWYAIGTFDGVHFQKEHPRLPGHLGRGFYAAQTFSDVPDGRRIQMGWWQTETRGMPVNQSMTIPLLLQLKTTPAGPRLTMNPVPELEQLRVKTYDLGALKMRPGAANPLDHIRHELIEVEVEFEPGDASEVIFNIRDIMVVYDPKTQTLRVDDIHAAAPLIDGKQHIRIYCDRIGVEVFASGGLCYVPLPRNTKPENQRLCFEVKDGQANVSALKVHELKSIWKRPH